jgi:methylated-DNA-[protein]-cysteine S-methyltransferase
MQPYSMVLDTPIGKIGLSVRGSVLTSLDLLYSNKEMRAIAPSSSFEKNIAQNVLTYFEKPCESFEIPYQLDVTPFQNRVLEALTQIPLGETRTYGELAQQLKTSPRAVGNACRRNPIAIIIPCHRIVSRLHLGGFAGKREGEPIVVKQWLLRHEAAVL